MNQRRQTQEATAVTQDRRHCQTNLSGSAKSTGLRGVVRVIGRELADRRSSRFSRSELTPFRECGGAVLFEGVAAVEVTAVVRVVVD